MALHSIRRLYPLWRDLTGIRPGAVVDPPILLLASPYLAAWLNAARDTYFHGGSPDVRLGRYATEIRGAVHELRRRAPEDLHTLARDLAWNEGFTGRDALVLTEAYWIKAAVGAGGWEAERPMPSPLPSSQHLDDEVPWLLAVAEAYRMIHPATAAALLAASGGPAQL
ncbi:DUF6545 domain-containing protein [Streptomyces sp. NPDC058256]|uniref:DUF6545 domain-containing protein n=1 Tax=Streptomyces sp. NPDC058256 TaxID=3346408 RepID=UPI0036E6F6D5